MRQAKGNEVDRWLDKDVLHHLLDIFKVIKKARNDLQPDLVDYYTQLNNQQIFKDQVIRKLWKPTRIIAICLFSTVLGYSVLSKYAWEFDYNLLLLYAAMLLLLFFWAFIEVIRYIKFAIDGPVVEIFNNNLCLEDDDARKKLIRFKEEEINYRIDKEKVELTKNIKKRLKEYRKN
jgi:hypothetical protein